MLSFSNNHFLFVLYELFHVDMFMTYLTDAVFGTRLRELCDREHTTVPKFVKMCVAAIENKGVQLYWYEAKPHGINIMAVRHQSYFCISWKRGKGHWFCHVNLICVRYEKLAMTTSWIVFKSLIEQERLCLDVWGTIVNKLHWTVMCMRFEIRCESS